VSGANEDIRLSGRERAEGFLVMAAAVTNPFHSELAEGFLTLH
jgi:hypothetical protein